MLLTAALKEWSVAVDALANGETILLLRKGGIKETQGQFSAESKQAILFPTFEHQKPALLKPKYQTSVASVESGWHPESILLKAWADITHIFLTKSIEQVDALSDLHIWQPQLVRERLKWKTAQPLYVLAMRVYLLQDPIEIAWNSSYGGCRSWISLEKSIDCNHQQTVLSDDTYRSQIEDISNRLL